jgi:spore germination protein GerM
MRQELIKSKLVKVLLVVFPTFIFFSLIISYLQPRFNPGRYRCVNGEWTIEGIPLREKPSIPCPENISEYEYESRTIQVFMAKMDENECAILLPVERKVLKKLDEQMLVYEAVDELYKGPTAEETSLGLITEFKEDKLDIKSVEIKDGVVTVNTNLYLRERNEDFCKFSRKQLQIYETFSRLPSVERVIITTAEGEKLEY